MEPSTPIPNKMGTMPIPQLLSMGTPMMLSMLVQALYNVVDSLFVSYIPDTAQIVNAGDKAVNALTVAFPASEVTACLAAAALSVHIYHRRMAGLIWQKERAEQCSARSLCQAKTLKKFSLAIISRSRALIPSRSSQ